MATSGGVWVAIREKAEAEKKSAEAETEKAGAELKSELTEKIRLLQSDIESAKTKLEEIRNAGEDQMEALKGQVRNWIG